MGSLYRLGQRFMDFCRAANQIEDSTLSVPTSHVVYEMNEELNDVKDALTTIRASSDISDCNAATALLSRYNSGTLNTPYKQGLINATSGILFSTKPANQNYCTQIAIPDSLDHIYIRYKSTGGFNAWTILA